MRAAILALSLSALTPETFAQLYRAAPPSSPVGTLISGGTVSGTWTKAGSPYRVIGDVVVAVGSSLVVEAGVSVLSAPGVEILVRGAITTEGSAREPVLFTALDPAQRWDRLRIATADVLSLEYTRIERAAQRGFHLQNGFVSKFSHCEVVDNAGGGILVESNAGDFLMEDCLVEGNGFTPFGNGAWGGGVYVDMVGTFRMQRCIVRGNRAQGLGGITFGGGMHVYRAFDVQLTDVLIEDNECISVAPISFLSECNASARGGGLALGCTCSPGPGEMNATLTRCIVRGNRAIATGIDPRCPAVDVEAQGGGLSFEVSGQSLTLNNVVVAGNVAWVDGNTEDVLGAGVWFRGDVLLATNCTVARNTAVEGQWIPSTGGEHSAGIHSDSSATEIRNSVLYGNELCVSFDPPSTSACSGATFPADPFVGAGNLSITYSDVDGGQGGLGNLSLPPLFAGPGTSYADLSIIAGSPCVDAGNPAGLYADASFPPSLGGPRCDMGHNGGPRAAGWLLWNF